ncbi:fibronectin type III domain-containing protein [bacterium]|nr:fibronectin type III domain-containing protein [bacterium]
MKVKLSGLRQITHRYWRTIIIISTPVITFLIAWLISKTPVWEQALRTQPNEQNLNILPSLLASKSGMAWFLTLLLILSIGIYVWVDYLIHAKPLFESSIRTKYTPLHHIRVVALPRIKHNWAILTKTLMAGSSANILLMFVLLVFTSGVRAASPDVVTNSASNITHGSARLNGTISDDGGASLSSRGFEYGTDTSYGKTLSEDLPDSGSYDTWGETKNGTTLLNSRVVYHENFVYVGGPGKVQKFTPEGSYVSSIGSLGEGSGQFLAANGITFDASDNMFVFDGSDNMEPGFRAITKFATDGTVLARWGERGCAEGQFSKGMGAIVSDSSYIYVLDTGCNRIQKYDTSGNFIATWGWGVDDGSAALQVCTSGCQAGISGSGVGQLSNVATGIYLDGSSLYVADSSNNRIQVFDTSGGYINAWGSAGSGLGQFIMPTDITKVGTTLYVIETFNNRVQSFTTTGSPIAVWGTQGTNDGQFQMPFSITADSNNLYTAELSIFGGMNRIQKFTTSGSHLDTWGEPGPGELAFPSDIAFAPDGSLYAISQATFNVHHFSATGEALGSWGGGLGSGPGQFGGSIHGIAVDSSGNVYVSDKNDRIQKFSSTGTLLATWGTHGSGDNQFSTPAGIAIDNSNNVYVADKDNNRIQKFSSSGSFIEMWGWGVDDGSNVFQTCSSGCQAGIQGTGNGQFASLHGLEFNSSNQLLAADGNLGGRVQTFSTTGVYQSQWAFDGGGSCNGCYVTVDEQDNVYVTNSNSIKKYNPDGSFLANIGSQGYGAEQFQDVRGIAVDGQGNVYVADEYKSLIHKYPQPISSNFFLTTSKLLCETTYHYRAFAVNSDGTGYGSDQTFLTGSCTNATVPSAPSGLNTSLVAYDSIAINWQEPSDFGGRALGDYIYEYKKSSDSTWMGDVTPNLSEMIGPLDENTSYDFRVAATNSVGTGPYTYMTVSTVDGGASHTLSSCADLETINYDLIGTYTLAQDIDCSGYNRTIQASGGEEYTFDGFFPIGAYSSDGFGFRGTLNGNGYKINNLKINTTAMKLGSTGLFRVTAGATIQNLQLANIDYDVSGNGYVGGIVGYALRTTFTNVSTTGSITGQLSTNHAILTMGGIAGTLEVESYLHKVYSSVNQTVTQDLAANESSLMVGGLSGSFGYGTVMNGSFLPPEWSQDFPSPDEIVSGHLEDTYYTGSINVTGIDDAETTPFIGGIGGILIQGVIENTYFGGSIITSNTSSWIGGIAPPGASGAMIIRNSFVAGSISNGNTVPNPFMGTNTVPLTAFATSGAPYPDSIIQGNFYDKTAIDGDYCYYYAVINNPPVGVNNPAHCQAVNTDGSQPNYFKNNSVNGPFTEWDFDNVWFVWSNDFPKFIAQQQSTPSPTPTLTPTPTQNPPTATPTPSTQPPPLPPVSPLPSPPTTSQLMPGTSNSLFVPMASPTPTRAVDSKVTGTLLDGFLTQVKQMPDVIALAIPLIIILILIMIALLYARQAWIEYRNQKRLNTVVDRFKYTRQASQNFVGLVSHYFNTPIGIMQLAFGQLKEEKALTTQQMSHINQAINSIASDAKQLITGAQQTNEEIAVAYKEQTMIQSKNPFRQLGVWLPSLLVGIILLLLNIIYRAANRNTLSFTVAFLEVFCFIGGVLLLIFAHQSREKHIALKNAIQRQADLEKDLLSRRVDFIHKATEKFESDLAIINMYTRSIKSGSTAAQFKAGAAQLARLIARLKSLAVMERLDPVNQTPISLGAAVNTAREAIAKIQKSENVTYDIDIPLNMYSSMNATALHQVLTSVIENAVNYATQNSSIQIRGALKNGLPIITVQNQGFVIPKKQLDQLMTPFSRAVDVLRYDHEGLGLSLYLDKVIMERVGGEISITSSEKSGTVVTLMLPKN